MGSGAGVGVGVAVAGLGEGVGTGVAVGVGISVKVGGTEIMVGVAVAKGSAVSTTSGEATGTLSSVPGPLGPEQAPSRTTTATIRVTPTVPRVMDRIRRFVSMTIPEIWWRNW